MNIRIANEEEKQLAFELRFEVFVDEQGVPREIELDEEDAHALHILAEENGTVIGCARLLLQEGEAHIGRLAVKKAYRSRGVGSAICRFLIDHCRAHGHSYIWLNAQLRATRFYKSLGFAPQGETFMEAGIAHIRMEMHEKERT